MSAQWRHTCGTLTTHRDHRRRFFRSKNFDTKDVHNTAATCRKHLAGNPLRPEPTNIDCSALAWTTVKRQGTLFHVIPPGQSLAKKPMSLWYLPYVLSRNILWLLLICDGDTAGVHTLYSASGIASRTAAHVAGVQSVCDTENLISAYRGLSSQSTLFYFEIRRCSSI